MLLEIHPDNPDPRRVQKVVDCLIKGGVVIYPTDSVYGIGCDMMNSRAIEKVARIKGVKSEKAKFSIICYDLSHITDFIKPMTNPVFKLMKKSLPGPYTFILRAANSIPKIFKSKKKTIGIRVPDNNIPREIVKLLGNPIVTTSIHDEDTIIEYTTDPELIYDHYKDKVDIVINGGFGKNVPTTIIDCSEGEPELIREGIGEVDL